MEERSLGREGLRVSAMGLGCMGMSEFYGAGDEAESIATIAPRARARRHPPRHRRHVRTVHQRGAARPRAARAGATRSCSPPSSATSAGPTAPGSASTAAPSTCAPPARPRCAASASTTSTSTTSTASTPPCPIEETVGAMAELVEGGQGALPRPLRGRARDHPPRPRGASRHRRCRPSTRCGAATWRRASCRRLRELGIGFVAYSPLGRGFLTGGFRRPEDLPDGDWRRSSPRFQGENLEANLRLVERVEAIAREQGRHRRPAGAGLGARPRRRRRADPRHQAAALAGGERGRAEGEAHGGRPGPDRRRGPARCRGGRALLRRGDEARGAVIDSVNSASAPPGPPAPSPRPTRAGRLPVRAARRWRG